MSKILRVVLPPLFVLLTYLPIQAQPRITTYAGPELPRIGAAATTQAIDAPFAILLDPDGGFYVSSFSHNRVYHIAPDGSLRLIAGSSYGFGGDGGPATAAQFRGAFGIALDGSGNLYIADTKNHRIRKVTPAGVITTVAGNGTPGYSGDGGPAIAAQLQNPDGIAVDRAGNLYIADELNHRIRFVTPDGRISTVAGNGARGFSGDGGSATSAQLNQPAGVALDGFGNLFIAEFGGHRVRKVAGLSQITTVAGTGAPGYSGDGGLATQAQLNSPIGVSADGNGNLYIADSANHRIRRVALSTGSIGFVAGTGTAGYEGDGVPASEAPLSSPAGVATDMLGDVFIADTGNNRIRAVFGGNISTMAGQGTMGFTGDFGLATSAQLNTPRGLAMDRDGNLYIADTSNNRIRRVNTTGVIQTLAGGGLSSALGDGGSATLATLNGPSGVALDSSGALYIADTLNHRIRKVSLTGAISTIAGFGTQGYAGDGELAIYAKFNAPRSVAVDASGNVYIADTLNHRIRKISGDGKISTIAGTGVPGDGGDGGVATIAVLNTPTAVAVDNVGNLYIADTGNRRIRKINTSSGTIFTVAGTTGAGVPGINGDGLGATASTAVLSTPTGVAVDADGNVFISEMSTGRVRVVNRDGIIRTAVGIGIAGDPLFGFSGDGGSPTTAQLNAPQGLAFDASGNLYVADTGNHRVRKVTQPSPPVEGRVFTVSSRGGISLTTLAFASSTVVGYGRIQSSDSALSGLAIFGYRQGNVLISEAAVPATRATTSGRIYARIGAETTGTKVNTGLAIANPNDSPAEISFSFAGSASLSGSTQIPPRGQIAAFLDQAPFNGGSSFEGTFTFISSSPVAVTALRGLTNERGEFLVTTLPVADLSKAATGTVFIPHFADGGGWRTQVALINPTDSSIEGTVQFLDQAGNALTVTANDSTDSTFHYVLRPREAFRLATAGASQSVTVGSVRVVPLQSSPSPTGLAIFSFRQGGITVTEAGVPSTPSATGFHMYAEAAPSIQSGIAIANVTATPATVSVTLDRMDGTSTGLVGTLIVPPNGQVAAFLNQILPGLPPSVQGVLRISSSTPVAVIGLRATTNERNDFLITTTPAASEPGPATNAELFFPHFADSGGYTTQFILLSGSNVPVAGSLRLVSQSGQTVELALR